MKQLILLALLVVATLSQTTTVTTSKTVDQNRSLLFNVDLKYFGCGPEYSCSGYGTCKQQTNSEGGTYYTCVCYSEYSGRYCSNSVQGEKDNMLNLNADINTYAVTHGVDFSKTLDEQTPKVIDNVDEFTMQLLTWAMDVSLTDSQNERVAMILNQVTTGSNEFENISQAQNAYYAIQALRTKILHNNQLTKKEKNEILSKQQLKDIVGRVVQRVIYFMEKYTVNTFDLSIGNQVGTIQKKQSDPEVTMALGSSTEDPETKTKLGAAKAVIGLVKRTDVQYLQLSTYDCQDSESHCQNVFNTVEVNAFNALGHRVQVTDQQITITIPAKLAELEDVVCQWWDEQKQAFSTEGVKFQSMANKLVTCTSTHLTEFTAYSKGYESSVEATSGLLWLATTILLVIALL